MEAQQAGQVAERELKRVKRQQTLQKSRFEAKDESVQEVKRQLSAASSKVMDLKKKVATLESR